MQKDAATIQAELGAPFAAEDLEWRNYPVFVDNMESIDDLNNVRPTGQVLMARCMKDTDLRVTPIRPILAEMETAA